MSDPLTPALVSAPVAGSGDTGPILLLVSGLDTRLIALESNSKKSGMKKLLENAGAVGLILGLILTLSSLYDVFVRKPEADRIAAISQFNQAVNSAAKTRQDLLQAQGADMSVRLAMASMATPRILNDISTAKALLPTLDAKDVGIPQLLILIYESMTSGDLASAEIFTRRAVAKTDATPSMQSEAKRYEGKYFFYSGNFQAGRQSFERALSLLGDVPITAAARSFVLSDLISTEFLYGDCGHVEKDIERLASLLGTQMISLEVKMQMTASIVLQIEQFSGKRCQIPANFNLLKHG